MKTPRLDIFVKTWRNDLCWLSYSLSFLQKNWLEWLEPDSRIIVIADANCRDVVEQWGFGPKVRYYYCTPWPDGYNHAQFMKVRADEFTDAELIMLIDSDMMMIEPASRKDFMDGDRPVIHWEYCAELLAHYASINAVFPWPTLVKRLTKIEPEKEYMQIQPMIYRADTFRGTRRLITQAHGWPLEQIAFSGVPFDPIKFEQHPHSFTDHNCLGLYADLYQHDLYEWRQSKWEPSNTRQRKLTWFHSWTQWNDQTQIELDKLLAK